MSFRGRTSKRFGPQRGAGDLRKWATASWQRQKIDLDVYKRQLAGLLVAEVEFKSRNRPRTPHRPSWFGREVTEEKEYKNSMLATQKKRTEHASIKSPIRVPVSPQYAVQCYPCREVPLKLQLIASLSRRRHGFDSRRDANIQKHLQDPTISSARPETSTNKGIASG